MARGRRRSLYVVVLALLGVGAFSLGGNVIGQPSGVTAPSEPIQSQPAFADIPTEDWNRMLPGDDRMETIAAIGLGPCADQSKSQIIDVAGTTTVRRGQPVPPGTAWTMPTEIVALQLSGSDPLFGPVIVQQSSDPAMRSTGGVSSPDGMFPADSFFDVFVEISLPAVQKTFKNTQAIMMSTRIYGLPPIGSAYEGGPTPIKLFDKASGAEAPFCIFHVQHVPVPPALFKIKKELIEIERTILVIDKLRERVGNKTEARCAEGSVREGFQMYATLFSETTQTVVVKFITDAGAVTQEVFLPADIRRTIDVNDFLAAKLPAAQDVSIIARGPSTFSLSCVVYFKRNIGKAGDVVGGHAQDGQTN